MEIRFYFNKFKDFRSLNFKKLSSWPRARNLSFFDQKFINRSLTKMEDAFTQSYMNQTRGNYVISSQKWQSVPVFIYAIMMYDFFVQVTHQYHSTATTMTWFGTIWFFRKTHATVSGPSFLRPMNVREYDTKYVWNIWSNSHRSCGRYDLKWQFELIFFYLLLLCLHYSKDLW